MELFVRKITTKDSLVWDELINSSPQGSIFLLNDCISLWANSDPALHLLRFGCFDEHHRLLGGQAFLYKKKALGIRVQPILNISYSCSPILAGHIIMGSQDYFAIMQALARKVERSFLYFSIECHPSIRDVRPLLQKGWRATPDYAHTWNIDDREMILKTLGSKGRYRHAKSAFEHLNFADETGSKIIEEFIPLYKETAQRYEVEVNNTWGSAFRKRVEWMLNQGVIRFYTCRKKDGQLLGVANYVLSRPDQTAYGWLLAYDLARDEKDFLPALYLYSIKNLPAGYHTIDIAEGIRPCLYDFKDSLGTISMQFFLAETPSAQTWKRFYGRLRNLKIAVLKLTQQFTGKHA